MATLETDLMKEYRRQCHENAKSRRRHWKRIRQMLKLAIGKTNYLKLKCRDIPDPSSDKFLNRYGVLEINVFGRSIIVNADYPEDGDYNVTFLTRLRGSEGFFRLIALNSAIFAPEKRTPEFQQQNFKTLLQCVACEFQDEIHLELEKALQSARVEKAGEFPKEAFEVSEVEKVTSINWDWVGGECPKCQLLQTDEYPF